MRFTISAAALVAFISTALAQTEGFDAITNPTKDENVPAGETYTIVWEPTAKYPGTVSITLLGGSAPDKLETKATLASGFDNSAGKFDWAVDSSLGEDSTYGIQITLDSDKSTFQYSNPFHIKAGEKGSSDSGSGYPTGSKTGSGYPTGTATVTISKSTPSSYPTYSANSTTTYSTKAPHHNSTYSASAPTLVTSTSTATGGGSGSSPTTSSPPTVSTAGAASLAAGSAAMLGGLAMAVFAL